MKGKGDGEVVLASRKKHADIGRFNSISPFIFISSFESTAPLVFFTRVRCSYFHLLILSFLLSLSLAHLQLLSFLQRYTLRFGFHRSFRLTHAVAAKSVLTHSEDTEDTCRYCNACGHFTSELKLLKADAIYTIEKQTMFSEVRH